MPHYHFEDYVSLESIQRDFLQESKRGKLTDDLVTKAGFQNHISILSLMETYQSVSVSINLKIILSLTEM